MAEEEVPTGSAVDPAVLDKFDAEIEDSESYFDRFVMKKAKNFYLKGQERIARSALPKDVRDQDVFSSLPEPAKYDPAPIEDETPAPTLGELARNESTLTSPRSVFASAPPSGATAEEQQEWYRQEQLRWDKYARDRQGLSNTRTALKSDLDWNEREAKAKEMRRKATEKETKDDVQEAHYNWHKKMLIATHGSWSKDLPVVPVADEAEKYMVESLAAGDTDARHIFSADGTLDEDVYKVLNNYARKEFGREYDSPEELAEFFAEDHKRAKETHDRSMEFLSKALTGVTEAEAAEVEELYDKLLTAYRAYEENPTAETQAEAQLRQKEFVSVYQPIQKRAADAEDRPGIIGILPEAQQWTSSMPVIEDRDVESHIASLLSPSMAERTLLEMSKDDAYLQMVDSGVRALIDMPVEQKRQLFGVARGNQLESAYSFYAGKKLGNDLIVPMAYDPTTERAPLDLRHHENAIKAHAYIYYMGEIIRREGPPPSDPDERNRVLDERFERATKLADEQAKAAVERFKYGQSAPYFTRDPDQKLEKFLNGESFLGAVANAAGFMYDWIMPQGQIQRRVLPVVRGEIDWDKEGAVKDWFVGSDHRSLEAGVFRNVAALMLPYRKIGGKVFVDGEGRYSVTPGFAAEMLGEKWYPLDSAFRVLGPFSEGLGAAYRVALRELMEEADNGQIAHDQGFGMALVSRMAEKIRDSDEVTIAMTETTDNVGPLLMGLPKSLFGADPKYQAPRTMLGLGLFAGLIAEPGPIEAAIVAKRGTQGLRFKDPIRTKLGLTTTTELTRGLQAVQDEFGSLDDIRNLTVDQLEDIQKRLAKVATGDRVGGAQVAVRTIRNEAMMGINQTTSRMAADFLQQAIDQATAFTKSADDIANRTRNTANVVYMERARQGIENAATLGKKKIKEVEADIEKVLRQSDDSLTPEQIKAIQDDFLLDIQEQVFRLKAQEAIVEGQRNAIAVMKSNLDNMKALEAVFGVFGKGVHLRKPVSDVLDAFKTMSDPDASLRARKKAVAKLSEILDVADASKPRAKGVYDLDDVFSYINDVMLTRQVKADDLARRVKELWPGGKAGRHVSPELRAQRAKVRTEIEEMLGHALQYGGELSVAATAAKIAGMEKALAVEETKFAELGQKAVDWMGTANAAVKSFTPEIAQLPEGVGAAAVKLIESMEQEVRKLKYTPESLELQLQRIENLKKAFPELTNRALHEVKNALINNMELLEILKTDPTVLKRIAQTSRLGWLVDQKGGVVRVGDKVGEEIRVTDWEAMVKLEDAQFEQLIGTFLKGDLTDVQKAEFIRDLFSRGSYMVHMFETPTGKLFKGAKAGLRSYAQLFAGQGVELMGNWVRGLITEPRATYFYTMAQFRPGGRMYGFSSFFQKTLGINSVTTSTRWELFSIRQQTRIRNVVKDTTRLIKFRTEEALQRGEDAIDVKEAQKQAYREAMTTTGRIEIVDPRTTHVLHDLTGFISETSIVEDAIRSILYSAEANPQAAQAAKAYGPDMMNTEAAFWGVLEAFLPDISDVKVGGRVPSADEWQALVFKYHNVVIDEVVKKMGPIIDDTPPGALYDDLFTLIEDQINLVFGVKKAGGAMIAKAENIKLYHDALILSATHHRTAQAMLIELGNFNPTMARSANALLSDTFESKPFQTVPLQVGDLVVPIRKIKRMQSIMGTPITKAEIEEIRALDGSLVRRADEILESGLDFSRADDALGRAEDIGAAALKRPYEVENAFFKLDTTETAKILALFKEGDTLPDGTVLAKGDKPHAWLEGIQDPVPLDEITRQSDHYSMAFLDGIEGILAFGLRTVDDALSESETQKFLTMRSRLDSMAQRFIIHSYNPKNPNNPVLIPQQFFSYFNDVIDNTRKLTATAAKNSPTVRNNWALYDRTLAFFKETMLLGFMGLGRPAMIPVQLFGDLMSMAVTVDRVPSMAKIGMGGVLGYMGNRVAKAWDELAIKLDEEATSKGRTWLAPMAVSMMNPTLAKVLTADPSVKVRFADGSLVDCRTAFKMMADDIGNTSIVSEGAGQLLARQSQRLNRSLDPMTQSWFVKMFDNLHAGAPASKYKAVRAADKSLFMVKRMIRQSVETGTLRTRQAQWLDTMQNISANRNVARDRLNYALINWTSDMRQWDMEWLSRIAIFPTFQKGYLRQGWLSMFDMPSTDLGEYIQRYMKGATGPQRMEMWYRVVDYSRDRLLKPEPGKEYEEEEARELVRRGEYPTYNFDRVLVDFDRLDKESQELFADAKIARTYQYRVLPGAQSLLFYKTVAEASLLMGAMLSYGADTVGLADREVGAPGIAELMGDFIGNFAWDHISVGFDAMTRVARGTTDYKSHYGPKLSMGEAEALMFLGMSDIILPDARGSYRLNANGTAGYITPGSAARATVAYGLRESSMLKDFHRAASAYGILDPTSPTAPVSVQQMAQQYEGDIGNWRARFDAMLNIAGVLERRFLHLENAQHYSKVRMAKELQMREAIWQHRAEEPIQEKLKREVINTSNEDELLSD